MMGLGSLLVRAVLMLGTVLACPSHDCPCFQQAEIDCTDMYFKAVPDWFPENITYYMLDLSKNKIRRLDAHAFKGLQVTKLRIKDNKHEMVVHPDSLRGLEEHLRSLVLKHARVDVLPAGMFKGMKALRQIDLGDNGMITVVPETFRGARNVIELSLLNNKLTKLSGRAFVGLRSLKELHLARNDMYQVDSLAFKGLASLEYLAMDHNMLRDLQPKTFKKLPSLRRLDLDHNELEALFPLMFKGLQKLEILSLSHNPIFMIAEDTFKSLTACTELVLANTKLATLKPGMFNGMDKLRVLHLSKNQIKDLPDALFQQNPGLVKLLIDSNRLTSVNPCAFKDVRTVAEINAWRNDIHCDCALKWSSLASTPTVRGRCASPAAEKDKDISDPNRYSVCTFSGMECEENSNANDADVNTPLRFWLRYRRAYQKAPYLFYGKKK